MQMTFIRIDVRHRNIVNNKMIKTTKNTNQIICAEERNKINKNQRRYVEIIIDFRFYQSEAKKNQKLKNNVENVHQQL